MKGEIVVTQKELSDRGLWGEYCQMAGINEWAVAEGLMDSSEELTLTFEQARKLGILDEILGE